MFFMQTWLPIWWTIRSKTKTSNIRWGSCVSSRAVRNSNVLMMKVGSLCSRPAGAHEIRNVEENSSKIKSNLLSLLLILWTPIIFNHISLRWLILKKRQGQKIDTPPQIPHHHHHFHHYMKYDRERNPTMLCKCRRELASRRHKRYACIIWPGEHHLWGDSQRP